MDTVFVVDRGTSKNPNLCDESSQTDTISQLTDINSNRTPPMPPPPKPIDSGADNNNNNVDNKNDKGFLEGDGVHNRGNCEVQSNSSKPHIPKSFAAIFKDSANILRSGKLRFIPPVFTEIGTKHASIPDELLRKQNEEWLLTLVGMFIGKRPAFSFVKFHAFRLWKRYDLVDVILNDQGFFYFKFKSEQGLQYVLRNRPWLFNDIPVLLKHWDPDIEFEKPRPTTVSLWVNIYDLHDRMWDYDILSHIVSVIGVPIAIDRYTEEMCEEKKGRAVFARVLVKVNADEDIPSYVEALVLGKMKKFRLQYYWKPDRCSHCNTFGHKFIDCTDRPRLAEEMEARMTTIDPAYEANQNEGNQDFQQPKRRRRRPKKAEIAGVTQIPKQYSPKNPEKLEDPKSSAMDPPPLDTASPDTQSSTHVPVQLDIPTSPDPVVDADTTDLVVDADTVAPEPLSSSSGPIYVGTSTNAESDSDKIWRYRDTTGKIHGPFSLAQLLKWSEEGYFPPDHKIWRISSSEKESMLLRYVLEKRAIHISASNGSDNQKLGGSLKFSDGG